MEINVNLKSKSYKVIIEKGILSKVNNFINKDKKILIVSDDLVPFNYIQCVQNQFNNAYTYIFEHGEKSKNFDTYLNIINTLMKNNFSRHDYVIALGGGVVGDVAGFASMTYKRGLHFINIPTTTLSMVDSSIGGKTAINYNSTKNVIGGFYQPDIVLIDVNTLFTLPKRHFINGTIEALKTGLLGDKELFDILKNSDFKDNYEEIIYRSLMFKKKIVEEDEKENGIRKILNFGHTFGHAIEAYYHMNGFLHGEAIGIGMLLVSKDKPYYQDLKDILNKWKVNTNINIGDENKILKLIENDKKCDNNMVDLIIVDDFNKVKIEPTLVNDLYKYLGAE